MRQSLADSPLSRRHFLRAGAFVLAGAALGSVPLAGAGEQPGSSGMRPVYKSLKIGMVKVDGSLTEKFRAVREAGFHGIELDSPGLDVEEVRRAISESGLPVDGTVCRTHWQVRHSDPDPEVRARALEDLKEAIRQTHAIGGHSVLLVPAHGKDGSPEEVWKRSFENISRAVPLAAELGVVIAIENVWNHFLYEHDGPADQTADEYARYIDAFRSPWVGAHFDIGNHQKYGDPAGWIRTLGKRIVKLDAKDWGRERGWSEIGQGDVDWAEVRRALAETGYSGWVAAEVGGGGADRLREVSGQLDKVFELE